MAKIKFNVSLKNIKEISSFVSEGKKQKRQLKVSLLKGKQMYITTGQEDLNEKIVKDIRLYFSPSEN